MKIKLDKDKVIEIGGGIWSSVKEFFKNPKVTILFVLLLLSLSANCGGYVYGKYKDVMIERARKKLEQADRRFLKLRVTAENSIKAYEDLYKKVQKELSKNEKLKASIKKKKDELRKDFNEEKKRVDKMGIGSLLKEFKKHGYGTQTDKDKKQ